MKRWNPTIEQLVCRDIQHSWEPYTAHREKKGFVRVLSCTRCGSLKTQTLDQDGYIVGSAMKYPDGYLRPEGRMTKADRADLRKANIHG